MQINNFWGEYDALSSTMGGEGEILGKSGGRKRVMAEGRGFLAPPPQDVFGTFPYEGKTTRK